MVVERDGKAFQTQPGHDARSMTRDRPLRPQRLPTCLRLRTRPPCGRIARLHRPVQCVPHAPAAGGRRILQPARPDAACDSGMILEDVAGAIRDAATQVRTRIIPERIEQRQGRDGSATKPAGRSSDDRANSHRYLAAVMNWENVSHQTITLVYWAASTPSGRTTTKLRNVLTSPTRIIRGLRRLKSASVSTNSGER